MSYLYDGFETAGGAGRFASTVVAFYPMRSAAVCATQAASNELDPFPFKLDPYIVVVTRRAIDTEADERLLADLADTHGGKYRGT